MSIAVVTVIVVARALLFADVLLNLYYVLMNAYGWYYWLYGGQQLRAQAGEQLPQRITVKTVLALSCITLLGSAWAADPAPKEKAPRDVGPFPCLCEGGADQSDASSFLISSPLS